jgi:hypothetical protein
MKLEILCTELAIHKQSVLTNCVADASGSRRHKAKWNCATSLRRPWRHWSGYYSVNKVHIDTYASNVNTVVNILYVTGLVTTTRGNTNTVTDLVHNTVFIKQKDVVFTNDKWKIVLNTELAFYEERLAKKKDDLHQTRKANTLFAPTHILKQVYTLLDELECEMNAFWEILPRLDDRRAVLNVAGSFF